MPNRCLADFVALVATGIESIASSAEDTRARGQKDLKDYVGLFAVTTGLNIEKKESQFEAAHDDYSAILLKALAKSLAMHPAASVSGFYLSHPRAQYFNVGRIGDDQVQNMAVRRGVAVE